MKTRKSYSKEFKLDAVSLVTEQNHKVAEEARILGLCANILGRWVKEQESEGAHAFRGNVWCQLAIFFSASGLMDEVSVVKETSENTYVSICNDLGDFSIELLDG